MYKSILKPLLFLFEPEKAHHITFTLLRFLHRIPGGNKLIRASFSMEDKRLRKDLMGVSFPNPVGLAAGLDKNGAFIESLSSLGFGFIEVGTVTPRAQSGNPKPRLFRLPKDAALINRMGFNNYGLEELASQLEGRKSGIIVGANIGKNKDTPEEDAVDDYLKCIYKLHSLVDYFTINVSSPNTPNLRNLQQKEPLKKLLAAIMKAVRQNPEPKPVLLKIAPDLTNEALDNIIELVKELRLAGIVATNTTIERSGLKTHEERVSRLGPGGLSGKPLRERSTEVVRYLSQRSEGKFIVVGVGGIHSPADALEKLNAGASLVQIYTGMIYEGPALVKQINEAILATEV